MFIELQPDNYHKVRDMFSRIEEIDLSVTSVFENNYPGRILVDNVNNPSTAFLNLGQRTFIFVGVETNKDFNLSIVEEINEIIIPTKMSHFVNKFFYIIFDKNWQTTIPKLFPESILETRKYYVFDILKIHDWQHLLPKSYSVKQFDKATLQNRAVKEHRMINKWITDIYETHEVFLDRSMGFCMLYNDEEVVSYNIVNYINDNRDRIEMGIITEEKFQRKGLAKLLVSATLEYCTSKGISKIGWHTNVKNVASQKTALSVGFRHKRDYIIYIGSFS